MTHDASHATSSIEVVTSSAQGQREIPDFVQLVPNSVLYVDVLELRVSGRGNFEQLAYQFERSIPFSLDDLHLVFLQLDSSRYLACGIEHETLDQVLSPTDDNSANHVEPRWLSPQEIPLSLIHDAAESSDLNLGLNLLTGPYTPASVQRAVRKAGAVLLICMTILTAMIGFGLERRTQHNRSELARIKAATQSIYAQVLPSSDATRGGENAAQQHARMVSELRLLERTRAPDEAGGTSDSVSVSASASRSLVALLAAWPTQISVQTESVSVTESTMTAITSVGSMTEAASLASGFDDETLHHAGWAMHQPQTRSVGSDRVRVTLRFSRVDPDGRSLGGARP